VTHGLIGICRKWHNLPEKTNAIRGVRGLFRVEKTIVGHADASILSALNLEID
jgi:hypothetical protein